MWHFVVYLSRSGAVFLSRRPLWNSGLLFAILLLPRLAAAGEGLYGGRSLVRVPMADTVEKNRLELGLWGTTFVVGDSATFRPGPFWGTVGLAKRFEISLAAAVLADDDPTVRPGMVDPIILAGKFRFIEERYFLPGLALRIEGIRADWTVDFHPQLAIQKTISRVKLGLSGGYHIAYDREPEHRRAITFGFGIQTLFSRLTLVVEATGRVDETVQYKDGSVRASFQIGFNLTENIAVAVVAEKAWGDHVADFRALAGLSFSSVPEHKTDRDGDKVPDIEDECNFEQEDINQYEDEDGCPEGGAPEDRDSSKGKAKSFSTPTPKFRLKIPLLEHPADRTREFTAPSEPIEPPPEGQEDGGKGQLEPKPGEPIETPDQAPPDRSVEREPEP